MLGRDDARVECEQLVPSRGTLCVCERVLARVILIAVHVGLQYAIEIPVLATVWRVRQLELSDAVSLTMGFGHEQWNARGMELDAMGVLQQVDDAHAVVGGLCGVVGKAATGHLDRQRRQTNV
jgi:hypothetical protein